MNYLRKFSLLVAIIIPALTACSSGESLKQAELDFDYLNIEKTDDLLLPEGVESPAYNHEYSLLSLGNNAPKAYLGGKVDVRSPALVLPITAGSRVEHRQSAVILWIDIPEGVTQMEAILWEVIKDYLASEQVEIASFSAENGELDTDWYSTSNNDDSSVYNLKQRYQYLVSAKPHGRTIGLSAKLLGYQKQVVKAGAWDKDISAVDSQRYSVQALNKLILYFDTHREEYQAKAQSSKPNLLLAEEHKVDELGIAVDEEGDDSSVDLEVEAVSAPNIKASGNFDSDVPLIILDAPFSSIGPALQHSLSAMGFFIGTVIAIDGDVKLKFTPPDPEYLAEFDIPPLTLEEGSYQLMVGDLTTKTSLLFSDGSGRLLEQWKVKQLLAHFIPLMADGVYPKKTTK